METRNEFFQTTARVEFLGAEIIKDKGLSCKFIIAVVSTMAIRKKNWKLEDNHVKTIAVPN